LKGGESQLVIEAGGIFPTTPKLFESKAQQHLFKSGGKANFVLPHLPLLNLKLDDVVLEYLHSDGTPVKGAEYEMLCSDGSIKRGRLDEQGKAVVSGVSAGKAKIQYGEDQSITNYPPLDIDDWFVKEEPISQNNNE
jgi:type VI secretion system secreted protein VgrG